MFGVVLSLDMELGERSGMGRKPMACGGCNLEEYLQRYAQRTHHTGFKCQRRLHIDRKSRGKQHLLDAPKKLIDTLSRMKKALSKGLELEDKGVLLKTFCLKEIRKFLLKTLVGPRTSLPKTKHDLKAQGRFKVKLGRRGEEETEDEVDVKEEDDGEPQVKVRAGEKVFQSNQRTMMMAFLQQIPCFIHHHDDVGM